MYRDIVKRILDIVLALCGLLILWPVMLIIAAAIRIESPGPVFFRQSRSGLHKKPFTLIKFRTMKVGAPSAIPTAEIDELGRYTTRIGRFLRRTSLDELPQLWHILVGEMSVVGPRPVILQEKALIAERDRYGANDVRPGLTGWAQINGRDTLSMKEKARYDGEYVRHLSFRFDCLCFFRTIGKVLRCDGVLEK